MTTFDREMLNSKFKEKFDKEFREFALQELISAMAERDKKSARALAKAAG